MFQEMNFSHVILDSFNIWKLSKAQDAISHQALVWNNDWWSTIFESFNAHTKQIFFTNRSELNHFSTITQLEHCTLTFLQFSRSQQALTAITNQPENKKMQHGNELQQAGPRCFFDWITSLFGLVWAKFHFWTRMVQLNMNSKESSLKSLVGFMSPQQEFEPLQMTT